MAIVSRLASSFSKVYAERIEPLVFSFRLAKRLAVFDIRGVDDLDTGVLMHEAGCEVDPACARLVKRYRRYYARYARREADGAQISAGGVPSVLPLHRFADFGAYEKVMRKKSGNFVRSAKKARETGYTTARFAFSNHVPDICEIRKSKVFRAFGPVLDAVFLTEDSIGGPPAALQSVSPLACPSHWEAFLGVFVDAPGHRQGEVVVDRKLVAYVRLHRVGNTVRYAEFMGHGDHLHGGVMMLLHMDIIRWLLRADAPESQGIQYITYGCLEQGGEGLLFWKRKARFEPMLLAFPQEGGAREVVPDPA
ncbi:hypothetical protein [Zoogloea dura]|jgi:hypothetical protein|uniref:BioF2-like acetyltransferase domain-containing protein n=1 Tax=Zoogloea dura TaxID=2728840 RepID=A0A848G0S9_9RHOO|nr:hypothetical protein [Zoogloea dura]NML24719.1 hypothetical protein [Zoogloea dura]